MIWPTEMGTFTWNSKNLIWIGAHPLDLEQAWSPADFEEDNHRQPGVDGLLPREVFLTQGEFAIKYHLSGLFLPNGSPASNVAAGIAANYAELISRVGSPVPGSTGAWPTRKGVTASVKRSDNVTVTGLVQGSVSRLGAREGSVGTCELRVVVPAGALA